MKLKDLTKYVNDEMLQTIYEAREDEIYELKSMVIFFF